MSFWPFWIGALALSGVALGHLLLLRRPMGVSGNFSAALDSAGHEPEMHAPGTPLRRSTHVLFLVGVVAGAAGAAWSAGARPTFDLGETYEALIGSGAIAWLALFGGGVLVGLGTRMAAGCTSGHGLVGCSSLRPGSLVATACFFGIGIAVSFVLGGLAS